MTSGDEGRPDGREPTPQTRRLRVATRALRSHLDTLPIDYHLDVSADRFLSGLAFMFARQRYDCADSLIGAGFGGTVLGSMARSLFVDGLRWLWIADDPARRRYLLGDLIEERNRILGVFDDTGASCPILSRWLMPLPDVADLTGRSMTWLNAQPIPGEDELLRGFVAGADIGVPDADAAASHDDDAHRALMRRARALMDMAGLRGAVLVLSHAAHGNYLGLQSSLSGDGAVGHDLRADHEALFMQVAAAGVTATLLGSATAVPELWPPDVAKDPFLERAVDLSAEVTSAAVVVHRLDSSRRPSPPIKASTRRRGAVLLRPGAVIVAGDLLPDVNSVDRVLSAAERYYELARSEQFDAWEFGDPSLHTMLAYGGGHSNLQTVMSSCDQPASAIICVFAARMLLEEAARLRWRFSAAEPAAFKARANQYFDDFRARRKKTIDLLVGSGVHRADAQRIFALPRNVRVETPEDRIAKNRQPLPPITSMLRQMGAPYPEPGWLEVAYSLMSQLTHSTPIGHLHTVRVDRDSWHGNELSPEMLGLALDTACLGSAHLIGMSAVILAGGSDRARRYHAELLREAGHVHDAARLVHGLD